MPALFADRADAGRRLATLVAEAVPPGRPDVVVLGLPRGGVPVAAEVAARLGAPLDVALVRKLGVPFQPEVAMGAVGEGGVLVTDDALIRHVGVTEEELEAAVGSEREVLARQTRFRGGRPPVLLAGTVAVVVDDGVATGATARAACQVVRERGAARVVLAVPVAPPGWEAGLRDVADVLVCAVCPRDFHAVGQAYRDFGQTTDDEVLAALARG
jgi:putative phosphoribosyl transferase